MFCIYGYVRFDELEQYSIALNFTHHQISKTKNSVKLPGCAITSIVLASLYRVFAIYKEVCVIHISLLSTKLVT